MKKQFILGALLVSGLALGVFSNSEEASAHGYVEQPAARGYMGSLEKNTIGWTQAYQKYGNVITNPQSLEFSKGFPLRGPEDGRIASAQGGLGQIGDSVLDEQSADRWNKTDIEPGINTFTWKYTAAHRTSKWHYYMTKTGWNPNKPLSRGELELIGTIQHDGSFSSNNLSHKIEIPSDRSGYHVILAVWDVADTSNAFYNVIDVNVKNKEQQEIKDTEAPTQPTALRATNVTTHSATINWNASTDNTGVKEYRVYRNGQKVGTVSRTSFEDQNLAANTRYSYQIEAVDFAGNVSEKSQALAVQKQAVPTVDTEAPSQPTHLHTMNITKDSVDLMWAASTDNVGVKEYHIYRDGKKVGVSTTNRYNDTNLKADTTYSYTVVALDAAGNKSVVSTALSVTTKKEETVKPITPSNTTWEETKIYLYGDTVTYNGVTYKAQWWTRGQKPGTNSVWVEVSNGTSEIKEWSASKTYLKGDRVSYKGREYTAQWWIKGEIPGSAQWGAWKLVK